MAHMLFDKRDEQTHIIFVFLLTNLDFVRLTGQIFTPKPPAILTTVLLYFYSGFESISRRK